MLTREDCYPVNCQNFSTESQPANYQSGRSIVVHQAKRWSDPKGPLQPERGCQQVWWEPLVAFSNCGGRRWVAVPQSKRFDHAALQFQAICAGGRAPLPRNEKLSEQLFSGGEAANKQLQRPLSPSHPCSEQLHTDLLSSPPDPFGFVQHDHHVQQIIGMYDVCACSSPLSATPTLFTLHLLLRFSLLSAGRSPHVSLLPAQGSF